MLQIHRFVFNPFQENTYILYNETGKCLIIDPGFSDETERDTFTRFIDEKKLEPVYLLNTHCHIDHILGNQFVYDTWKLPLHIHQGEQAVLQSGPRVAEMYGFPLEVYTGPLVFLDVTDTILLGSDVITLLFTPGHSPASLSFYHKESGILISGDTLFSGSIGRTDLPGGDFTTLERSIRTQLYSLPDATKVYSGHGPGTSIGHERQYNPFVKED
ncbi:MBL fold metallo-hydrolase [Niabella drilacis]|uniref:Glyoxylase, beta-lactamase superfamily II n=1 Tax=Niabella drilacis (strain DSM 25811 / CCM 8410 / CCUG 62505 / LMG 26954 / E90) TaxID=1285928 RepID=A0A1G6NRV8_NIADE|nr:MBL fold metallo-hydrolase [Niabella drilacis]SDC70633.1 Glyoxylase, beta-lactamase superfamily II [Niabella drilacis]